MKRLKIPIVILVVAILAAVGVAIARENSSRQDHDMKMMKMMDMRSSATKRAAAQIQSEKKAQAKKGHYGCCLKHSCDFCAMSMGSCPCGMAAAKDMPVCNECKGGWAAGDGAIPGKKAEDIKTMPRGHGM